MRKNIFILIILPLLLTFALILFSASPAKAEPPGRCQHNPVTLCHYTPAQGGKYIRLTVDDDSVVKKGGHGDHPRDIIPPFKYLMYEFIEMGSECPTNPSAYVSIFQAPGMTCSRKKGRIWYYTFPILVPIFGCVEHDYPGLNWDTLGQATWENGCHVPCDELGDPIYGEWSDWALDPQNTLLEIRTRTVTYPDKYNSEIVCSVEEDKEEREVKLCVYTTEFIGEWSEWETDPSDSSQEIRSRTIEYYDINNPKYLCESEEEEETRPFDSCTFTTESIGEWGAWIIDPSDDTREMRTRTISYLDQFNPEVVCSTRTETEYRDIEEEGEVLGESTSVVLAETGPSDNTLVYLVEAILLVLTSISFVFLGKEYIKKTA